MVNEIRRAWEDAMDVILHVRDWGKVEETYKRMRKDRLKYLKHGPFAQGAGLPSDRAFHFEMALEVALEYRDYRVVQDIKDELERVRLIHTEAGLSDKYWDVEDGITRMLDMGVLPKWTSDYIRDLDTAEERLFALLTGGREKAERLGIIECPKGPDVSDEMVYAFAQEVRDWDRAEIDDNEGLLESTRQELERSVRFVRDHEMLAGVE